VDQKRFLRWAAETLRALLLIVRLERDGRPFEPTGLRLRRASAAPVRQSELQGRLHASLAAREEPEITLAWLVLRAILEHFELLEEGSAVEPGSFALRRLEDWTFEQDSGAAMLAALSAPCPLRCEFCYERGLPDGQAPVMRPRAGNEELEARIALWRRGLDVAGLRGLRYGEVLPHPRFAEIFRLIRDLTSAPLPVATAGPGLNETAIRAMSGAPRALLQLSLNTCDPARRQRMMGDRRGAELLRALGLLEERQVAFVASAVAWPGLPWDDLEATIQAAEAHGALHFIVFLPSFSRFFAGTAPFDWRARWQETVEFVRRLRRRAAVPIRIAPDGWETLHAFADPLALEVLGATVGSPAQAAGLRPGDLVVEMDGHSFHSRPALNRALEAGWTQKREVSLLAERDGQRLRVSLAPPDSSSSYAAELDAPYGLHVYEGPDELRLRRLCELMARTDTRHAWVLCSQLLAQPYQRLWERTQAQLPADGLALEFVPVANNFWGGNIVVGDLLTAQDFAEAALARLAGGKGAPEALFVPPSPFHPAYWKDLRGDSFFEIQRRTGVPTLPILGEENK
jgi:pyruvate-formate lyase-activating enzyme